MTPHRSFALLSVLVCMIYLSSSVTALPSSKPFKIAVQIPPSQIVQDHALKDQDIKQTLAIVERGLNKMHNDALKNALQLPDEIAPLFKGQSRAQGQKSNVNPDKINTLYSMNVHICCMDCLPDQIVHHMGCPIGTTTSAVTHENPQNHMKQSGKTRFASAYKGKDDIFVYLERGFWFISRTEERAEELAYLLFDVLNPKGEMEIPLGYAKLLMTYMGAKVKPPAYCDAPGYKKAPQRGIFGTLMHWVAPEGINLGVAGVIGS